jgi:purine-binding chemotaxis protein CheW
MTSGGLERDRALIVTVGTRACAIPVEHVGETMRPLPIESIADMPEFIRGVSVIRGTAVPVVDLGALLQTSDRSDTYGRFVTVKIGERRVAVAVDGVVGLRNLDLTQIGELPPLLRASDPRVIDAIGTCDAQLLIVLGAMRLVPDEVWMALEARERGQ